MGFTIDVNCGEKHNDGPEARVGRLEKVLAGDPGAHWIVYAQVQQPRGQERMAESNVETVDGVVVDTYEEIFGEPRDRSNKPRTAKLDLKCDYPFCGFHFQRHWQVVAPVLDILEEHRVACIDLRALARRVDSTRVSE